MSDFFLEDPIGYSDRVGFDPNRSQPDRVCKFQTDRVSIPTRSDPNPKFIGSGRVGSDRVKCPPLDLSLFFSIKDLGPFFIKNDLCPFLTKNYLAIQKIFLSQTVKYMI